MKEDFKGHRDEMVISAKQVIQCGMDLMETGVQKNTW